MHAFDRQTDGQIDRRTEFSSLNNDILTFYLFVCIDVEATTASTTTTASPLAAEETSTTSNATPDSPSASSSTGIYVIV